MKKIRERKAALDAPEFYPEDLRPINGSQILVEHNRVVISRRGEILGSGFTDKEAIRSALARAREE